MVAAITEAPRVYAVEVSGWDNHEDFFVENTELQWSEESAGLIHMTHPIASGTLLFLRLLDPTSLDRVHPVPYVAKRVVAEDSGGFRVELIPARRQSY
jgi:hypothetical protein